MSDRAVPAGGERLANIVVPVLVIPLLLGMVGLLGYALLMVADLAGRPLERVDAVVASRSWHPADTTLRVAPAIASNGQVSTVLLTDSEPESYEVCLSLEGRQPCAKVRPARYEALRPGTPVVALVRHGRFTGSLQAVRVLDDGE